MRKILFVLVIGIFLFGMVGMVKADIYGGYLNSSDKVFYYKFNQGSGNATDETGNYNGTINGGIIYNLTNGISGFGNYTAANYEPGNVFFENTFKPNSIDNLSLEFRVKQGDTGQSNRITGNINGTTLGKGFRVAINASGYFNLLVSNGAGYQINDEATPMGCGELNNSQWHHVVVTKNSSHAWRLYIDGVYCGVDRIADINGISGNNWRIFAQFTSVNAYNGSIDQVIYWNKTLSAAEVLAANNSERDSAIPIINTTSNIYNTSSTELLTESIQTNITTLSGYAVSNATLHYGSLTYSGTVTNTSAYNYTLTKTGINLNSSHVGSNTLYWNVTFTNGTSENTDSITQSVSATNFTLCAAAPYNIPYINFSFKNETLAQESVSASFSSTWVYWISSQTNNKTLSYTNTTANPSYAFCLSPGNKTISSTLSSSYYNSYSVQRNYAPGTLSLSNATTNTTLWLLPTSDGLYVTFQVINLAEQVIQGTLVNISRSGVGLIESKETDDAGLATFFMNPNFAYTIEATKTGYPAFSTSITPTQSSYTITLGGGITSSTNISDYFKGVSYTIGPAKAFLDNDTVYQFNISLSSSFWDIDSFGFVLRNNSGGIVVSNSSTSNGGLVSYSLNVGTNASIKMDYFWVIGGNYTNASTYWIVSDTSGTGFSLWHFGTRLRTYITGGVGDTDGLFGLTSFGLNIIVFFIIIISTGLVAFKVGFDRPLLIVGVMLAVTFLFDVVLTLITYPETITNVLPVGGATLIIALVFIGIYIKEQTQ